MELIRRKKTTKFLRTFSLIFSRFPPSLPCARRHSPINPLGLRRALTPHDPHPSVGATESCQRPVPHPGWTLGKGVVSPREEGGGVPPPGRGGYSCHAGYYCQQSVHGRLPIAFSRFHVGIGSVPGVQANFPGVSLKLWVGEQAARSMCGNVFTNLHHSLIPSPASIPHSSPKGPGIEPGEYPPPPPRVPAQLAAWEVVPPFLYPLCWRRPTSWG